MKRNQNWIMLSRTIVIALGIMFWAIIEMTDSPSCWYIIPSGMIILSFEQLYKTIERQFRKEKTLSQKNEAAFSEKPSKVNIDNWDLLGLNEDNPASSVYENLNKPFKKFVL